MKDGLVDIAYRSNETEKELMARGIYPYRQGEIVDLSYASDLEERDYIGSDSDGISKEIRIKRQGEKLNPRANYYARFLNDIENKFDIPLDKLSRETMVRELARYFPSRFGKNGKRDLSEESDETINGTFNGLVDYARNQRRLLEGWTRQNNQ